MSPKFIWALAISALVAQSAFAFEAKSPIPPGSPIPFNTNATPLEQHGGREAWAIGMFVLIAAGAIYVIRRKKLLPDLPNSRNKRLKIVERTRLNPKSTLYIVEFDQRTVLVGQCGDNLVCLVDAGVPSPEPDNSRV